MNADPQLLSAVVLLRPTGRLTLALDHGRWVHAWFLKDFVGRRDPALAALLHGAPAATDASIATRVAVWRQELYGAIASDSACEQAKPFTLSMLQGCESSTPGTLDLDPDQPCWLRVTAIAPVLAEWLADEFRALDGRVRLGPATLDVIGVATSPDEHPWARRDTVRRLESHASRMAVDVRTIRWHFHSPTVFRSGRRLLPFPLPALVLGRPADCWHHFVAADGVPQDLEAVDGAIQVEDYSLETEYVGLDGGRHGFRGECMMRIGRGAPAATVRAIHLLAALAFYTGVGAKTPMGLGQVSVSWPGRARGEPPRRVASGHARKHRAS